MASLGIYPAIDPLNSSSRLLDPLVVGAEHYEVAQSVISILQRFKELQDIIAILGMGELSEEDKKVVARSTEELETFITTIHCCWKIFWN
ncbi:hypothetical protein [Mycoplasmopsis cynos]|uniref:ATP synthase beta subunit C-terminal domain-containing protein n=1 Tax=Mycoplasmopsis cynos TaxID=171284 RepID=UPI003A5C78E0